MLLDLIEGFSSIGVFSNFFYDSLNGVMLRLISISYGLLVGVMILALFLSGDGDLHGWLVLTDYDSYYENG